MDNLPEKLKEVFDNKQKHVECVKKISNIKNVRFIKMEELVQLCIEKLPEYSRPTKYVFTNRLPMTAAGKIDYKKLESIENNTK